MFLILLNYVNVSAQNEYYENPLTEEERVWYDWFNSLTQEEQDTISFRPPNFVEIQREVYGIEIYFEKPDDKKLQIYSMPTPSYPEPTPAPSRGTDQAGGRFFCLVFSGK